MKLLVIEDDSKTAAYLRQGLSEHGFVVDTMAGGDDGLHLALTGRYHLIILDVLLPQRDGWSVLTELRRHEVQAAILMLTAQDAVPDRVKGLELGADDYLVKPFAFSELLARVRALLRRGSARQPDILNLADLQVDLLRHRAQRGSAKLDLTPQEFALLSLLIRHTGEVLSRTLIAEQVWDINFHSDTNVVDVAIRRLRRKVDEPFATRLIHTVRGVGYVLETR
ncbi:heavy metal response regulator transcription factor [Candidatus Entotheonella palauensis]|uniref:heavy metal response regulator transcription factor n=1 Tax=Candidatus Entotheonella palauensis TaxID=93172 RepID=UPI000B7C8783|nr:heavy metal response regulator transcription factor [Candidatus Entotheonella palauensis]